MDEISTWKRDSRRGNYSILMGSLVFVIMGFAALSVDIALITLSELQAQAAADSASHAALVAYRQATTRSAGESLGLNAASYVVGNSEVGLGTPQMDAIRFGLFDHQTQVFQFPPPTGNVNAVQVDVSRQGGNAVDLLLAPLLGVNTHSVQATSTTSQQQRAIMLVQDASCSMMGGGAGAAINVARTANTVFLDYLVDFPQDGDMLGIAQYATDAALGLEVGGGRTSIFPAYDTVPWAQLREIEFQEGYLRDRIGGICDTTGWWGRCPAGNAHPWVWDTWVDGVLYQGIGSLTNPGIAMEQAIGQLRDQTDSTYFRGMVVFSDGFFNWGGSSGLGGNGRANLAATTAWDEYDINVWTILYSNGGGDAGVMAGLVRGAGFFQNSPNVGDLPTMYEEVARSIPTVLVF